MNLKYPVFLNQEDFKTQSLYLDALYQIIKNDFMVGKTFYRGDRVALKRYPERHDGYSKAFLHLISTGEEPPRDLDIERCKRIKWPKFIIDNEKHTDIKIWENRRNGEKRIVLFAEKENYVVILSIRNKYLNLCTTYCIEREHRKRKLLKEYEEFKKKRGSHN